jgi:hypothetical protein
MENRAAFSMRFNGAARHRFHLTSAACTASVALAQRSVKGRNGVQFCADEADGDSGKLCRLKRLCQLAAESSVAARKYAHDEST